eukprot:3910411-Rhodomonas_salina.1
MPFALVFKTTGRPRTSIVGKEHSAAGTSSAQRLGAHVSCACSSLFWMSMGLAESIAAPF